MKKLKYFIILILVSISCQKDEPVATNGNIAGRVTDKVSNEPISGAAVTVKGNQITTGSDGTFAVNDIYADTYQISVSKLGYVSDSKSVVVSPEKTSRADFSLARLLPVATPTSLAFDRENLERSLTLENKQSEKLSYTLETSKSWISANPQSGTIESSNQKIITVNIDPQTLEYGTYNETLIVNVAASSLSIPIAFVYEQDSYISITSPETDGVYKMGEIMPIQWDSNLNGKVSIELLKSSSTMLEIASEVENNDGGNYSWEIPALNADAYILKISSVEYPDITTQSGAFLLEEGPTKPVVETGETTEVTVNTIKIKGLIESLGIQASEVSQHGHVYSKTNELPTIADDRTNLGSTTSTGEYESLISGLVPGDSYYIRAYAINQKGASYGVVKLISTVIGAPALTTGAAIDIMQTKATLSASLDSSGGGTVSERGIIWGDTAPLNNESNTVVADGVQEGEYSVDLTSLSPGTTYYYKAYAINPNGIGYGEQKSFRTYGTEATIYTLDPNNILATKFTARGRIDSNGGESLTSYGFVYATTENPTLENEKVEVAASDFTGEFNIEINNLTPSTVYFVRSYATNSIGTVYGDQKSITTLSGTPQAETTEITSFNAISATIKGKIISDAGEELLAYGIVYSTDDNPTTDDTKVEASQNTNGVFTITLDELSPSTKYYVRAFVSNVVDTGYGEVLTFTTENGLAQINTVAASNITFNSAKINGNYVSQGAANTTELGFVVGSDSTVDLTSGTKYTIDAIEIGEISKQLTELNELTEYFYKAYAKNEFGIAYGESKSFTTLEEPYLSISAPNGFSEGIVGETLTISWLTNLGNKLINISVVDLIGSEAQIAIGLTASTQSVNWNIPEGFTLGDYKIRITDKATGELLAETALFSIIEGCNELPMQDSVFEKWLFDKGYDDLLDNKVKTCQIREITEIINPTISTRINWEYFINLNKLTINTGNYQSDIDLRENNKLTILNIHGGSNYSNKIYPNEQIKEIHSDISQSNGLNIGLDTYLVSSYPKLEVYDLPGISFQMEYGENLSNLLEINTGYTSASGIPDFTSYPNLKKLKMYSNKSQLIILKNNLNIESVTLVEDNDSTYYRNSSYCYNKIWVDESINTNSWDLKGREVINQSCIDISNIVKSLDEGSGEDITTIGEPSYTSNRYDAINKAIKLDGIDDAIVNAPSVILPTNYDNRNVIFWMKINDQFSGYKTIYSDQKYNANGSYGLDIMASQEENKILIKYNGRQEDKTAEINFIKFNEWIPVIINISNTYQHGNSEYTFSINVFLGDIGSEGFSIRDFYRGNNTRSSISIGSRKQSLFSDDFTDFLKVSIDDLWHSTRKLSSSDKYLITKDWIINN